MIGHQAPRNGIQANRAEQDLTGKPRFFHLQSRDDFFDAAETGWTYSLNNLSIYLEKLQGRTRRLISERIEVNMPRLKFWRHLLSDVGGFVLGGTGAVKGGDSIEVRLEKPVRAVVGMTVEGKGLALRIPELTDALLFVSLEGRTDTFHVGYRLSVYDDEQAKAMEEPAKAAFRRIHESVPD